MNSDVARFTTHIKPVWQQIRLLRDLNIGDKTRNIGIQLVLQQWSAMLQNKLHVSVTRFTEALDTWTGYFEKLITYITHLKNLSNLSQPCILFRNALNGGRLVFNGRRQPPPQSLCLSQGRGEQLLMNRKGPWEGYRQVQSPFHLPLHADFYRERNVWVQGRVSALSYCKNYSILLWYMVYGKNYL